jgi:hypothetical protein
MARATLPASRQVGTGTEPVIKVGDKQDWSAKKDLLAVEHPEACVGAGIGLQIATFLVISPTDESGKGTLRKPRYSSRSGLASGPNHYSAEPGLTEPWSL